jgi:hypothetical protein
MPRLRCSVPWSRRQVCPQMLYAAPRSARSGIESINPAVRDRERERDRSSSYFLLGLHRSKDGSHLINYIQWTSPEKLKAAH